MSFVIQYWFCHAIASLTLGERCHLEPELELFEVDDIGDDGDDDS